MNKVLEELRWKKFPVLDDGFVCLVDSMGEDSSVVQAAKISYGNDIRDETDMNTDTTDFPTKPCNFCGSTSDPQFEGTCNRDCCPQLEGPTWFERQQMDKDRTLLRYLMRNRHTTPFEMCEVKFLIRIPMDAWRQMVRHRTANINEYSTRYTEAIDAKQKTGTGEWRLQSGSNKQGSDGGVTEWPAGIISDDGKSVYFDDGPRPYNPRCSPGAYLSEQEDQFHEMASAVYSTRLKMGVAREQARKDLPLSTYTEAYWKCDLHNILHFLGLRMDSHAQLEIRSYANTIGHIIEQLFPQCWEAFCDYRLEAMQLSRMDILASHQFLSSHADIADKETIELCLVAAGFTNKREKEECIAKMKRLRIL